MVVAFFCFAAGIFFHSLLPQGSREVASLSSPSSAGTKGHGGKFDILASKALQSCLDDRVRGGNVDLNKVTVDGRNWAIVSLDCSGAKAKKLYDAVANYSSEQYVKYSDGRSGVARFFGRLYPPSQCVRVIRAAKGGEMNLYSCSVRVDLDHELTEGLKL
jgi:hypothetical protein